MKRVLKWNVLVGEPTLIGTGKVVHVAVQVPDVPVVQVWTEEVGEPNVIRWVQVFGTGHEVPTPPDRELEHLGSFFLYGGSFVGHLYGERPF